MKMHLMEEHPILMPFMMISVSKVAAVHLSPKFHVDILNFYSLRLVYCGFYQHSLNMKFHDFLNCYVNPRKTNAQVRCVILLIALL